MRLSRKELSGLLRLLELTRDEEVDCDGCLARLAEFAEEELAGRSISDSLGAIEQHLSICAECREEYEALREALGGMKA